MADIFDEIDISASPQKVDIFDQIEEGPSRERSLISAPIKGAVKGALDLAQLADPFKALLGLNEINPHQKQAIEKTLPTQKKSLEKGLERAGKLAVSAIGGPESLTAKGIRTGAGALLGQTAEEVGAPEWVQNLAELSAFISPRLQKGISPSKSQKEAVEFLRSKGLSDREITPLIQSERKLRMFSGFASKNPKTEKLTKNISSKLGENYDILKEKGAKDILKGDAALKFDDKLNEGLNKISRGFRRLIEKDVEDLRNREISAKSLIDFYQDINRVVKGQEGGRAVLNTLKPIITEGLESASPEIAKDYKLLNAYYAKNKNIIDAFKPGQLEKFLKGAKKFAYLGSAVTGNFSFLPKILGAETAQQVTRELLTNPRLQNISKQILQSVKNNNITTALKSLQILTKEIKKENPDIDLPED